LGGFDVVEVSKRSGTRSPKEAPRLPGICNRIRIASVVCKAAKRAGISPVTIQPVVDGAAAERNVTEPRS
jgi:hypothetical protein